ncbi:neural Wiskott-Aldrich syndrome protein [Epinephelus fuscoguttatus]|uniref:neural Wiskott-Aldrich syndrome protein n=1 Tax=Epinephelus fuscoguttatus TaxID=293821 RepID=UPI0020D1B585|nr:neural Wiskott-Aldrich syndrome protein [Epinephelus fuscoguttatus]
MASSLTPGIHAMSDLLTIREKGVLFTLLEPQCMLIKSTVAQVLVATETEGERPGWSCLGCGAVCLIEDTFIHSHFLRLYCVKRAKLLWEQELYVPFQYAATRTFFHTFPADGHQVGLNFANEAEAGEFLLAVEAVQRNQEKTTMMTEIAVTENKSTSDPPDSGTEPLEQLDEEPHSPVDEPSIAVTAPSSSNFKDLDPAMRRLLIRARLTEEDLKDKDVAEAVDCIINRFGGLKAVQRELRNRGPVSQTLPRATGASISLALKKGPLPPVPSIKGGTTSQQTPQCTDTQNQSQISSWIPPPPSTPAPGLPERLRKSASFKHVGSPAATGRGDPILTALTELFRQKQLLQGGTSADGRQLKPDTKSDEQF